MVDECQLLAQFEDVLCASTNLADAMSLMTDHLRDLPRNGSNFLLGVIFRQCLITHYEHFVANSKLFRLLVLTKYGSYRFSHLLWPNLLTTKPGSCGMTFLMDLAQTLSAPETVFTLTDQVGNPLPNRSHFKKWKRAVRNLFRHKKKLI